MGEAAEQSSVDVAYNDKRKTDSTREGLQYAEYDRLEARLQILLPEEYQHRYQEVQPVPMRSATLIYDEDGRVMWDEIWQSFCDLAMAGGPPHRGKLLEAGSTAEIAAMPDPYAAAVAETCRGVEAVTQLRTQPSAIPGWIRMACPTATMAAWLARAVNLENVSAHVDAESLYLPVSPYFRIDKEIKNVVTSIAKTTHYWTEHTSAAQHEAITRLLRELAGDLPLLQILLSPRDADGDTMDRLRAEVTNSIQSELGPLRWSSHYYGWLGLELASVRSAIWLVQLLMATNVLCRREDKAIYLPLSPSCTLPSTGLAFRFLHAHQIASSLGVL